MQHVFINLPSEEYPPSPNGWTRKCINMFEYFTVFSPFADDGIEFATRWLFFTNVAGDYWIDEVSVQQGENQSMLLFPTQV